MIINKAISLVKDYFEGSIPDYVKCIPYENKGMVFTDNNGKETIFKQDALNVWRSKFDYWLIEKAIQAGAELRAETSAVSCKMTELGVELLVHAKEDYAVQADYLIDCEGVTATFKQAFCGKRLETITTYQTFNEGEIGLDPHYFYAYLQPQLSEYDAWFNVKDGMLVIGVAVKDPQNVALYYERFVRYMKEKHDINIIKEIKRDRWLMPYIRNRPIIDYGHERVFFAGEVAGFLNPMGEGIYSGIESGHSIAQAIIECYETSNAVINNYIEKVKPLRAYMERQWALVKRMLNDG